MKFSLKSFIAVSLVVALGTGLVITARQSRESRAELRSLRAELGLLNVEDESKINVVSVTQTENKRWKWRIFLPPGHAYDLNLTSISIEESGYPTPVVTFWIDGGEEFTLTIDCKRNKQGRCVMTSWTTNGHQQEMYLLGQAHEPWLDSQMTDMYTVAGGDGPDAVEHSGPLELIRLRIKDNSEVTTEGVLAWIAHAPDRQ